MVSIGIFSRATVSSKRVRFIRHFLHLQIYIYIGISLAPFLYTSSRNFSLKLLHYIYICARGYCTDWYVVLFFFIFLLSTRRERPFTNHFASIFILFTQGGGKRVIEVFRYIVIAFLFSFFFFDNNICN